jgi:hypothetical protein
VSEWAGNVHTVSSLLSASSAVSAAPVPPSFLAPLPPHLGLPGVSSSGAFAVARRHLRDPVCG